MQVRQRVKVLTVLLWIPLGVVLGLLWQTCLEELSGSWLAPAAAVFGFISLLLFALLFARVVRNAVAVSRYSLQMLLLTTRRVRAESIYEELLQEGVEDFLRSMRQEHKGIIAREDTLARMLEHLARVYEEDVDELIASKIAGFDPTQQAPPTLNRQYQAYAALEPRKPGSGKRVAKAGRIAEELFAKVYSTKDGGLCPT